MRRSAAASAAGSELNEWICRNPYLVIATSAKGCVGKSSDRYFDGCCLCPSLLEERRVHQIDCDDQQLRRHAAIGNAGVILLFGIRRGLWARRLRRSRLRKFFEDADGLRLSVALQDEIFLLQAEQRLAVAAPHLHRHQNQLSRRRERGCGLLRRRRLLRIQREDGKQQENQQQSGRSAKLHRNTRV